MISGLDRLLPRSNQNGYVLNSLAFKTAGFGNSFATIQLYDLRIFSVSANGTTASLFGQLYRLRRRQRK